MEPTKPVISSAQIGESKVTRFSVDRFITGQASGDSTKAVLREPGVSNTGRKEELLEKLAIVSGKLYEEKGTHLSQRLSAQTVSRLPQGISDHVQAYHTREIEDTYVYLILDGIRMSVRSVGKARKRVALCLFGIDRCGQEEMIDFYLADGEGEAQWTRLLDSVYRRGPRGRCLRLVTSDGAPGLLAAVAAVWPHVPHQRCWVHKLRNVANKLPRRYQTQCLDDARPIYGARNEREAVEQFMLWCRTWRRRAPQAVTCLQKDIESLLRFFKDPEPLRAKLRTTNIIERSFREVR